MRHISKYQHSNEGCGSGGEEERLDNEAQASGGEGGEEDGRLEGEGRVRAGEVGGGGGGEGRMGL